MVYEENVMNAMMMRSLFLMGALLIVSEGGIAQTGTSSSADGTTSTITSSSAGSGSVGRLIHIDRFEKRGEELYAVVRMATGSAMIPGSAMYPKTSGMDVVGVMSSQAYTTSLGTSILASTSTINDPNGTMRINNPGGIVMSSTGDAEAITTTNTSIPALPPNSIVILPGRASGSTNLTSPANINSTSGNDLSGAISGNYDNTGSSLSVTRNQNLIKVPNSSSTINGSTEVASGTIISNGSLDTGSIAGSTTSSDIEMRMLERDLSAESSSSINNQSGSNVGDINAMMSVNGAETMTMIAIPVQIVAATCEGMRLNLSLDGKNLSIAENSDVAIEDDLSAVDNGVMTISITPDMVTGENAAQALCQISRFADDNAPTNALIDRLNAVIGAYENPSNSTR
jgi:hypothetical protein